MQTANDSNDPLWWVGAEWDVITTAEDIAIQKNMCTHMAVAYNEDSMFRHAIRSYTNSENPSVIGAAILQQMGHHIARDIEN